MLREVLLENNDDRWATTVLDLNLVRSLTTLLCWFSQNRGELQNSRIRNPEIQLTLEPSSDLIVAGALLIVHVPDPVADISASEINFSVVNNDNLTQHVHQSILIKKCIKVCDSQAVRWALLSMNYVHWCSVTVKTVWVIVRRSNGFGWLSCSRIFLMRCVR